jgi:predicted XRE-type DNA-binding protein
MQTTTKANPLVKKPITKTMPLPKLPKRSIAGGGTVEAGSGNIYADIGLPDADSLLIRSRLVISIKKIIEAKEWTQTQAAEVLGIHQSHVSRLTRGNSKGFSIDKLVDLLTQLGYRVEVKIGKATGDTI